MRDGAGRQALYVLFNFHRGPLRFHLTPFISVESGHPLRQLRASLPDAPRQLHCWVSDAGAVSALPQEVRKRLLGVIVRKPADLGQGFSNSL